MTSVTAGPEAAARAPLQRVAGAGRWIRSHKLLSIVLGI